MRIRKMYSLPVMALAVAVAAQPALADKGDWFMHVRAIQIAPDESPSAFEISDEWAPDLSIGYFMTDHFALDLLLSVPTKHDLAIGGTDAGSFKQIVLAAQKCPVRIIHPGTPLDPNEPDLDKWVEQAREFN